MANKSQWKCALKMTVIVNNLLKLNPSQFQKVIKYALFSSYVIVLKISRECFFFLLLQQLEIRPCYIYIRISKDTNIMISETFMHLQASLFDHNHLWCNIYIIKCITLPLSLSSLYSSLI